MSAAVSPAQTVGFFDGVKCFFGGLFLLVKSPSLWLIASIPVVLFVGGWMVFGGLSLAYVPKFVGGAIGATDSVLATVGVVLLKVIGTMLALALSALLALLVSQPLSGSALEALVRRQEKRLGAPLRPETPFFRDMIQSLQSVVVGLGIGLPVLILLALIGLFFPPSVVVVAPLKFLTATLVLAWDVCDLPLSLRGLPVKTRVQWLSSHKMAVLGFGLSCSLVELIPVLNFIVLPAALLGSTQLVWFIERQLPATNAPVGPS